MLLDKNPRAGFLSPPAPAGAARPRADFPGFPARLLRDGGHTPDHPPAPSHSTRDNRAAIVSNCLGAFGARGATLGRPASETVDNRVLC